MSSSPAAAADDKQAAQIVAMDDPVAWREAYTAANPQLLDSRPISPPPPPAAAAAAARPDMAERSEARPRVISDAVSGLSISDGSRRTMASSVRYSVVLSPTVSQYSGQEEEGGAGTAYRPTPPPKGQSSCHTIAELPG
ncbi:unnamed protein product [Discula destructiva]